MDFPQFLRLFWHHPGGITEQVAVPVGATVEIPPDVVGATHVTVEEHVAEPAAEEAAPVSTDITHAAPEPQPVDESGQPIPTPDEAAPEAVQG